MKPETFFAKFELLADAPDAVAKMREFVLQIAVQGKLVDQRPGEEPATKLLERIQKSKERLIQLRAIRRQETDPIDCNSAPFAIPQSWVWTRLGEIGDWGSGSTPERGNHEFYGGGITWLKSGELNDNPALVGSSETVTELALKRGSFRRNQPGDVLFALYGATVGKVAILSESAVTNQAVCGCTPFDGVLNRYLFAYLVSQRAAFHEASEGGAQPNLSKVKLVAFPFPLPPLAEQKRIVAKVDELMAMCDQLEAQQQERETRHAALARASLSRFAEAPTPSNLNFLFHKSYDITPADLRKSIFTLAVQGDLSANSSNPSEWPEVLMEDVCELITDGEHATPPRVSTGIPLATAKNVRDGFLNMAQTDYVAPETAEKCWKRCKPEHGDILMVCVGATTGRVCLLTDPPKMVLVRSVAVLRPSATRIEGKFLDLFLRSPSGQMQIWGGVRQNAQPCLYLGKMSRFTIRLPPLTEQRRIVAKVNHLMTFLDALEEQLTASRTSAKILLSAVLELTRLGNFDVS